MFSVTILDSECNERVYTARALIEIRGATDPYAKRAIIMAAQS